MAGPALASRSGAIILALAVGSEFRAAGFRRTDVPQFTQAVNLARQCCISVLFDQVETELCAWRRQKASRPAKAFDDYIGRPRKSIALRHSGGQDV
jgi:hypothetical protein